MNKDIFDKLWAEVNRGLSGCIWNTTLKMPGPASTRSG